MIETTNTVTDSIAETPLRDTLQPDIAFNQLSDHTITQPTLVVESRVAHVFVTPNSARNLNGNSDIDYLLGVSDTYVFKYVLCLGGCLTFRFHQCVFIILTGFENI